MKSTKRHVSVLNYVEHLLILASTVTGCASISAFASLVCVLVCITSSAVGIKMCAIAAGIKKYKSIIKKTKKKHVKIVLLGKEKSNIIEFLIPKALTLIWVGGWGELYPSPPPPLLVFP